MGPNPTKRVHISRGDGGTQIETCRRSAGEEGAGNWSGVTIYQGLRRIAGGHEKLGEHEAVFYLRSFQGLVLPKLDFQSSCFYNGEKIYFFCFEHPVCGNSYSRHWKLIQMVKAAKK